MARQKLFGWIDSRPLIWFHYVLLVVGFYLVMQAFPNLFLPNLQGFVVAVIVLGLIDQAVHHLIGVD